MAAPFDLKKALSDPETRAALLDAIRQAETEAGVDETAAEPVAAEPLPIINPEVTYPVYVEAGYDTQEFNTPTAHSPIVGIHDTPEGELLIEYLATGPSGLPEYKLTFESGRVLTVCCEDTAREYLASFEATKTRRRKAKVEPVTVELDHWKG